MEFPHRVLQVISISVELVRSSLYFLYALFPNISIKPILAYKVFWIIHLAASWKADWRLGLVLSCGLVNNLPYLLLF